MAEPDWKTKPLVMSGNYLERQMMNHPVVFYDELYLTAKNVKKILEELGEESAWIPTKERCKALVELLK